MPSLYRPGVGIMLLNADNKIFVGQRHDESSGAWQMPQGGIFPHEDPEEALYRELQEEIGTCNVEILARAKGWSTYDLPPKLAGRLWEGKFKGQRQLWYLLRFLGQDTDINLNTPCPEFRAWKWAEKDEIVPLAVSFKKSLYTQVLKELWDSGIENF